MNKSHQKTLDAIFQKPLPASLEWRRVEALLLACGAELIEGAGSRVRFVLNDVVATFHRPHPQKEAKAYQLKDARIFLEKSGVLKEISE